MCLAHPPLPLGLVRQSEHIKPHIVNTIPLTALISIHLICWRSDSAQRAAQRKQFCFVVRSPCSWSSPRRLSTYGAVLLVYVCGSLPAPRSDGLSLSCLSLKRGGLTLCWCPHTADPVPLDSVNQPPEIIAIFTATSQVDYHLTYTHTAGRSCLCHRGASR